MGPRRIDLRYVQCTVHGVRTRIPSSAVEQNQADEKREAEPIVSVQGEKRHEAWLVSSMNERTMIPNCTRVATRAAQPSRGAL